MPLSPWMSFFLSSSDFVWNRAQTRVYKWATQVQNLKRHSPLSVPRIEYLLKFCALALHLSHPDLGSDLEVRRCDGALVMEECRKDGKARVGHADVRAVADGFSWWVQWLRFQVPDAGGPGSIPDQGTRSRMLQQKPKISCLN